MDFDERTRIRVGLLLDACVAHGIRPSGDQRVTETDAATILDFSPRSLQRWREQGDGPTPTRIGGRISYSLSALAMFVELGTGQETVATPKRRRGSASPKGDKSRQTTTAKSSPRAQAEISRRRSDA